MDLEGTALVEREKPCHRESDEFKEAAGATDLPKDPSGREGTKQDIDDDDDGEDMFADENKVSLGDAKQ